MAAQSDANVETHVLSQQELLEVGQRYDIEINPDDVVQYKLCQVILALENNLQKLTE